jgi:hypothetical protein
MVKFAGRKPRPKQPAKVLATEIVAFLLVVLIALEEVFGDGRAHLWIGFVLAVSAIAGALGLLLENRRKKN